MRLLVCGSRQYPDPPGRHDLGLILDRLWVQAQDKDEELHIISGHSVTKGEKPVGPDWWAELWAMKHEQEGVTRTIISIKDVGGWAAHRGNQASYVRNTKLITDGLPTHTLALRTRGESKGTDMMIRLSDAARIPRFVLCPDMGLPDRIDWQLAL